MSREGRYDHHRDANPLILFDLVCNLRNVRVRFVIQRDPNGIFRFAAMANDETVADVARPLPSMAVEES